MKTALVMGITGGFGGHVARELASHGWQIRALTRDPKKLPINTPAIEAVSGDAANIADVRKAARGVDLIVYGVNAPYPEWEAKVVPWLDVTATVAEETGATGRRGRRSVTRSWPGGCPAARQPRRMEYG